MTIGQRHFLWFRYRKRAIHINRVSSLDHQCSFQCLTLSRTFFSSGTGGRRFLRKYKSFYDDETCKLYSTYKDISFQARNER